MPCQIGINLNIQQIELLNIVRAENKKELELVVQSTPNLHGKIGLNIIKISKTLEQAKKELFAMYQDGLISYYAGHVSANKKENIAKQLSNQIQIECSVRENWKNISFLNTAATKIEIWGQLKKHAPTCCNEIINYIYNLQIVEYHGIKHTTIEHFEKLLKHIAKFDIINVADCLSFPSYVMTNGQYNRRQLLTCLNFANQLHKQLNIGSLVFYKNMPDWIRIEKPHILIKRFVVKHLNLYVHDVSTCIRNYEKTINQSIVTSIELLREPLNTIYSASILDGYATRAALYHHHFFHKNKLVHDKNVTPGWFKYITIQDLCELSRIIRNALPNISISIGEYGLEDRRKSKAFISDVIQPIQEIEISKKTSVFDTIGCHCHCDTNTIPDDIICMLETLTPTNKIVKICEFDTYLPPTWQENIKEKDLNMYKSTFFHNLCQEISTYHQTAPILESFAIFSVNDYMNDTIAIINQNIYEENKQRSIVGLECQQKVVNVYGGYYDKDMNERIEDPIINQNRGD